MIQILYERDQIDLEKFDCYKIGPVKDNNGNSINDTYSLQMLLYEQTDFINKKLSYNVT